jgi:hypothetical protein
VLVGSVLFLLMIVNWAIESFKWRSLLRPFTRIGALRAFTATIAGTSLALVSPNRTGEFIGRIMFLEPEHRLKGAVATMLGGIAQFVITLAMGAPALLILAFSVGTKLPGGATLIWALAALAVMGATLAVIIYLDPVLLVRIILRFPFPLRWQDDISVLEGYDRAHLLQVLLLSLLRYLVFTLQFVLLLVVLEDGPSMAAALAAVPVIFLVSTVVPTVLLTELGVRGSVAMAVLEPTGSSEWTILLATFGIWLVNLLLPAVAGSLLLVMARIRTRSSR